MTETTAVVFWVLSLAILWLVTFDAWPAYRLAAFREDMFDTRDALFDLAAHNPAVFNHSSYKLLRMRINRVIQFGHRFTFVRLVIVLLMFKGQKVGAEDWALSVGELPHEIQQGLLNIHQQMVSRIACYLLHLSPSLLTLISGLASASQKDIAKREFVEKVEILEAQAVEEMEYEELAMAAV